MTLSLEKAGSNCASIVEASGLQSLAVGQAMGKVRSALVSEPQSSRNLYAVVVHSKKDVHPGSDHLKTWNSLIKAYWKSWRTLSRLDISHLSLPDQDHLTALRKQDFGDIRVFWVHGSEKEFSQKVDASPGVYIIPSHLDAESLGLPPLPQPFRQSLVVIQVKHRDTPEGGSKSSEEWNPWESLARSVRDEEHFDAEMERDTVEWRTRFMSENKVWTSAEVARQSSSTAKNRAAIASRWLAEKRVFSIPFEGKIWFPRFQFRDGRPIPVVSKVIKAFPKHGTGWDLAFFFTAPNSFIGGRKPVELLREDPKRVESLAQSFANPADAF